MKTWTGEEREPFVRDAIGRGIEVSMEGQRLLLRLLDAQRATVATEPERMRVALVKALRRESDRSPMQEVCDFLDTWADQIENGEDL